MSPKKKALNRRKPTAGGRPPYVPLAVVVALIVAVIFLLEHSRKEAPLQVQRQEHPLPHHKAIPAPVPVPEPAQTAPEKPTPPLVQAPKPQPEQPQPRPHFAGHGALAIIVDDMGTTTREAKELLSIDLPITFSVIPSLAKAKSVAQTAHDEGAEVMIHMPMEPQGYPKQRMEQIGLLVSMDETEIEKRVNSYFTTVPYAVGANNHMGSRFTEHGEKMEPVLKILKAHGFFFVDSMTSPRSAGYKTARALGLKCATRKVFLDNVQDVAAIKRQLAQAAEIAGKHGSAIAICHPHSATIQALKEMMPELARGGIKFVHASELVS